jgi:hypothetical protein
MSKWTAKDGILYDNSGRLNTTPLTQPEANMLAHLHNKDLAAVNEPPAGVFRTGPGPVVEVNTTTGEKK